MTAELLVRSIGSVGFGGVCVWERVQRQIDRLLDEAEEAAASKDWETARDRAEQVLTYDPENADGIAFLSAAQRALGVSAPRSTTLSTKSPLASSSHVTPVQPTAFANDRYQVKRFLGEGGKNVSTWPRTPCWTGR